MKIAVTAVGATKESAVDQRFGRAHYFLVYERETTKWSVLSNEKNLQALQGAGIQAAQAVMDSGASVVITGYCGPKAFRTLSAGGIQICQGVVGTVKNAVEAFLEGKIAVADKPNAEAHFKD